METSETRPQFLREPTFWVLLLLPIAIFVLTSCTSHPSTESTVSAKQTTDDLNSKYAGGKYALTADDVALLQSKGALDKNTAATVGRFVNR